MKRAELGPSARVALVVRHEALRGEIHRALELAGHRVVPVAATRSVSPTGIAADVWVVDREGGEPQCVAAIEAGLAPERIVWLGSVGPVTQLEGTAGPRGAFELAKPFSLLELEETVEACLDRARRPERPHDDFVLRSVEAGMRQVLDRAERLARLDVPVVLEGELGTGREALARAIHAWSGRAGEPLLELDPGRVAGEGRDDAVRMIESCVEAARWGALLVRDPADWPRAGQQALANALRAELGRPRCLTVMRGSLADRAERGDLSLELQYRLDAVSLRLPALRDRPLDQAALCRAAARRVARALGRATPELDRELVDALAREGFPGNRIGLESRLRAAMIRGDSAGALLPDDLAAVGAEPRERTGQLESLDLKTLERETIVRALAHWQGNRTRASESLGISVRTLRNKIRDYGLR